MPLGKVVTTTVIQVSHSELDTFISKHYGQEFSCCADQEWSNDSIHELSVDGKENCTESYDREPVEEFRKTGQGQWLLSKLMDDLASKGHIEKGDYVIRVSW